MFSRKTKEQPNQVNRSQYFSDSLYENKSIKIDKSFRLFVKRSVIDIPEVLIIRDINTIMIGGDVFEEIIFDSKHKMLYDPPNDTFYLMQFLYNEYDSENIKNDMVTLDNKEYASCTNIMESNRNELYRIYSRNISSDADEYLFVVLGKNSIESYWAAIILQPAMVLS